MSYWHLEQVISKLRRAIWKFWLENQRQTGIIKETQYTLQRASVPTLSALAFLFSCRYRATNRSVHIPANLVSDNQRREEEKQSTYRILQLSRNYQKSTGRGWRNPRDVWHAQSQIRWSDGHC